MENQPESVTTRPQTGGKIVQDHLQKNAVILILSLLLCQDVISYGVFNVFSLLPARADLN